MNQQIKQRIEQVNNGQVPTGYKETEFGIFPCDWVTDKTFGDLFSFNGGLGKSREELSENGIEYLHYGDMHRSDFNIASLEQYSKLPKYDTKIKGDESFLMQDGDVAFLDASEDLEGTSRSVLIDNPENKPFIAGLHIIYGKPRGKELSKYYKQYLTRPEYIKKQFKKLASGFKVYGLNRNTITGIKCAYPKSTAEQEKIAEILMKWDEAIVLYNRQIEKLKQLKSVCIKKMFPKKRSKVPEVRFKGFTKDWEQRKLSDIATMHARIGWQNLRTSEFLDSGDYMLITGTDFNDGAVNYSTCHFVEKERYEQDKHIQIKNGSILITKDGTLGKVAYVQGLSMPATLNAGVFNVEIKDETKVDNKYLFQYLKAPFLMDYVDKKATGGTIKHLNQNILIDFPVVMPSKAEQEAIGVYFEQLDNIITLHQRKVEKIKIQQKALQQYLLNGIVRVNV